MRPDDLIALIALGVLIGASAFAAVVYAFLVSRRYRDSFTWAVFGLLGALAATNVPVVFAILHEHLPLWVGASLRILAAAAVLRLSVSLVIQARGDFAIWRASRKSARAAERVGAREGDEDGTREE